MNDEIKQGNQIEANENTNVIGVLKVASGTVVAISPDGALRELTIGDPIYVGDLVESGTSHTVLIESADGILHTLGQGEAVKATPATLSILPEYEGGNALFDELLAAIEAGLDITTVVDGSTAGEGDNPSPTGDEIGQGALFSRSINEVNPEAGFDPGLVFPPPIDPTADTEISGNSSPDIKVDTGNPQGGNDSVSEAGLPGGSSPGDGSNLAGGTFSLSDPDGLDDIKTVTINGSEIAIADLGNNNGIVGDHGTLTVTSYDPTTGVAEYIYELAAPTTDEAGAETDVFTLSTSDGDLVSGSATITIEIVDDVPTATNDANSLGEDGSSVGGNVVTDSPADVQGADRPANVTAFRTGTEAAGSGTLGTVGGTALVGTHGTLSLAADGTYTYTLTSDQSGLDEGESVTDTFTYTLTDADGDPDQAELVITIIGSNDGPEIEVDPGNPQGGNDQVFEAGLSTGSDAASASEFAEGTFAVSDPDGLDDIVSVTINGEVIAIGDLGTNNEITTAIGKLTITSYNDVTGVASYTYELTSPTTDVAGVETDVFSLTTTDGTATSAATITIEIVDDVPTATNDNGNVDEGATLTVNAADGVLSNDQSGADGYDGTGAIVGVVSGSDAGIDTENGDVGSAISGIYGTLTLNADGSYTYVSVADAPTTDVSDTFVYTIKDGDGDLTSTTLTINVNNADPVLIVGSNADDQQGEDEDHTVPNVGGPVDGEIVGGGAGDILIGDSGGATVTAVDANIVFVLDTSGSMGSSISGVTRLQAMKDAVKAALQGLVDSDGQNIRVHIVEFSSGGSTVGTYELTLGGVDSNAELQRAFDDIDDLSAGGVTNYEAGLVEAEDWIDGGSAIQNADVNKVVFVSDGLPNRALNDGGGVIAVNAQDAIDHILGVDDSTNEVASIEASGFTIEAVGIDVGSNALALLSQVEGDNGSATNVTSADQLSAVIGDLASLVNLSDVGADVIIGSHGNDLIFGDSVNTDALATAQGLGTPAGSGWDVFQQLESTPGWDRSDTLNYLKNNHSDLAEESQNGSDVRSGGNDVIVAGAGDDIVYGQEGIDTIIGGLGSDTLSGGSGADMFVWAEGDAVDSPSDTLTDFSTAEGDVLDLSALLLDEENGDLTDYLSFTTNGTDTTITVDTDGIGAGSTGQTIVLQGTDLVTGGGSQQDIIDTLLAGNNLITDV